MVYLSVFSSEVETKAGANGEPPDGKSAMPVLTLGRAW